MTTRPILVVDPVTGAAVASDLTRLFSVGVLDLTCPTCGGGGRLWVEWAPGRHAWPVCTDCTKGQVAIPTDILVAADGGDPREWSYEMLSGIATLEAMGAIVRPAHILGTLHGVEALPVVDESEGTSPGVWVVSDAKARVRADGSSVYPRLLIATADPMADLIDVSDALPWGPWTPGGTAIRFDRFEASVPCPTCGGTGDTQAGRIVMRGGCGKCHGFGQKRCPISWPGAPATPGLHHIDLTEAVA